MTDDWHSTHEPPRVAVNIENFHTLKLLVNAIPCRAQYGYRHVNNWMHRSGIHAFFFAHSFSFADR
jgi:hypothetical protein